MYSAAFIFEPGEYDDTFYSLDEQIHEIAESIEGFIGRESWQSADGKKINAVYYWQDKDALKRFSAHHTHLAPICEVVQGVSRPDLRNPTLIW